MSGAFQSSAFQNNAWQVSAAVVGDAFQPNAFQRNAWQIAVLDAFQANAFQNNAYQTGDYVIPSIQGGGPGGWGAERARLEWSIRERMAQQTLQKAQSRPARRIARAMEDYSSERIAFETLRRRTESLLRQLEHQTGLAADLRQAARDVRQFIEDEQDALDMVLLADQMDAELMVMVLH